VKGPGRRALHYRAPVASAQVKTAVLLSGLYARGETTYTEPHPSRDHTEHLLRFLGLPLEQQGNTLKLQPHPVPGFRLRIHGDPSAAAPFVILGLLHPDAELVIHDINLNPRRRAYLDLLRAAGGDIHIEEHRDPDNPEPHGTLVVRSSTLENLNVSADRVPALMDELPFLALAATFARRPSRMEGLAELRVKESNRYQGVCSFLQEMGAHIRCRSEGWEIEPSRLHGGVVLESRMEHRMLFLGAIAGMLVEGGVRLQDPRWANVSHPGFFATLEALCAD
jgi:3-phosphoshikimate 1-carboxyvinyltransferase